MKRKPTNIVANLLDVLNGLNRKATYNYNELKEITGMHWETIRDYITLIGLIQNFSPKIEIDMKENKVGVLDYSNYISHMELEEQAIVILFLEKIFDPEKAIDIKDYFKIIPPEEYPKIEQSEFIKSTLIGNIKKYYLTRNGKFRAQGILSNIGSKMIEFIDHSGKISLPRIADYYLQLPEQKKYQIEQESLPLDENELNSIMSFCIEDPILKNKNQSTSASNTA